MRFSLEQNAADSLRRSVVYFAENSSSRLKAAVKELVSALELYVKAQLVRLDLDPENPVLVYECFKVSLTDAPKRYELVPIGVNMVRLPQALERLAWLGHEIAPADSTQIRELERVRNALEHSSVELEAPAVRSLYVAVVGFAIRYLHVYLGLSFIDIIDSTAWHRSLEIEPALHRVAERSAKKIYEDLIAATERAGGVSLCAKCGAALMIAPEGNWSGYRCVVCGFVHNVEECYACKRMFYMDMMHSWEGDTALCDACYAQIFY